MLLSIRYLGIIFHKLGLNLKNLFHHKQILICSIGRFEWHILFGDVWRMWLNATRHEIMFYTHSSDIVKGTLIIMLNLELHRFDIDQVLLNLICFHVNCCRIPFGWNYHQKLQAGSNDFAFKSKTFLPYSIVRFEWLWKILLK